MSHEPTSQRQHRTSIRQSLTLTGKVVSEATHPPKDSRDHKAGRSAGPPTIVPSHSHVYSSHQPHILGSGGKKRRPSVTGVFSNAPMTIPAVEAGSTAGSSSRPRSPPKSSAIPVPQSLSSATAVSKLASARSSPTRQTSKPPTTDTNPLATRRDIPSPMRNRPARKDTSGSSSTMSSMSSGISSMFSAGTERGNQTTPATTDMSASDSSPTAYSRKRITGTASQGQGSPGTAGSLRKPTTTTPVRSSEVSARRMDSPTAHRTTSTQPQPLSSAPVFEKEKSKISATTHTINPATIAVREGATSKLAPKRTSPIPPVSSSALPQPAKSKSHTIPASAPAPHSRSKKYTVSSSDEDDEDDEDDTIHMSTSRKASPALTPPAITIAPSPVPVTSSASASASSLRRTAGRHSRSSAVATASPTPPNSSKLLSKDKTSHVKPSASMPPPASTSRTRSSVRPATSEGNPTSKSFLAPPTQHAQRGVSPTLPPPSSSSSSKKLPSAPRGSTGRKSGTGGRSPIPPPTGSHHTTRSGSPASTKGLSQSNVNTLQSALLFTPGPSSPRSISSALSNHNDASTPALPTILRTNADRVKEKPRVVSTKMFQDDTVKPTLPDEGPPSFDNSFTSDDADGDEVGNVSALMATTLSPLRTPALSRTDATRFFLTTPARESDSPGTNLPSRQQMSYASPAPVLNTPTSSRLRPAARPLNDRGSIFSFDVLVERTRNLGADDEEIDVEKMLADIPMPFKPTDRLSILMPPMPGSGALDADTKSPTSPPLSAGSSLGSPTTTRGSISQAFSSTPQHSRRTRPRESASGARRLSIPKLSLSSPVEDDEPKGPDPQLEFLRMQLQSKDAQTAQCLEEIAALQTQLQSTQLELATQKESARTQQVTLESLETRLQSTQRAHELATAGWKKQLEVSVKAVSARVEWSTAAELANAERLVLQSEKDNLKIILAGLETSASCLFTLSSVYL